MKALSVDIYKIRNMILSMYKLKYKLAWFIVKVGSLFTKPFTDKHYKYVFLMEDIQREEYYESICRQMKKNWNWNGTENIEWSF